MAKTAAERSREYRERLKDKGAKQLRITLSPDEAIVMETFGKIAYPNMELTEVVHRLLMDACFKRLDKLAQRRGRDR